jgi:PLD-like domain/Domain of unknown function (DUF1998)
VLVTMAILPDELRRRGRLPAVENLGEGIFLLFNKDAIAAWLGRPAVQARARQLATGFELWKIDHDASRRLFPGAPYYMLHSLSHLLITAISLECGYPASSLRERIYASSGRYGVLIYTGSPDAEGTLGGLVESGREIRKHMRRALDIAVLCANDPVCAHYYPAEHDHQPLLGSACHGCLLIAETSCEQHNDFLDRLMARMRDDSSLRVIFCLNIGRPHGDTSLSGEIVRRFLHEFRTKHWPWPNLPELWYDPRALAESPNDRASLHAKCVIIDRKEAIITSANFTEAAQRRNIEVGMIIRYEPTVRRLTDYFSSLRESNILIRCHVPANSGVGRV